jgi:hypothetical protein
VISLYFAVIFTLLVFAVKACSDVPSRAEKACLAYGAPPNALYKKSTAYTYGGLIVSYAEPNSRAIKRVGCVITDGAVDVQKTKTMFDYEAIPQMEACLAEKVSLAPSGVNLRH